MSEDKAWAEFNAFWNDPEQEELRMSCAKGWAFEVWQASRASSVINIVATKNEQGQIVSVTLQDEDHRILEVIAEADVQPVQDVEALETALFGTPLDDVPNRDNDDIWSICHPHLPERASDALRDHLARIETALAAHRKQWRKDMSEYKLVPMEPTEEMVEAAQDAYMPFGDMDMAIRMALLAAPTVREEPVAWQRKDRPERIITKLSRRSVAEVESGVEFIPLYAAPQIS